MRPILTILIFLLLPQPLHAKTVFREGKASWYSSREACGPKTNPLANCPTASGHSIFKLESQGVRFAAMWNMPFGTRIKVTNRKNGRSVIVIVLDRGPNKRLHSRSIDLCKRAFQDIADHRTGILQVKLEVLP